MKLRNKKTEEIKEFSLFDGKELQGGATLESLTEEWEDYEDSRDFWFIDDEGDIGVEGIEFEEHLDKMKAIGNYFETKEEAEKAVEKLKAWKRLKDNGFRVKGWYTVGAGCLKVTIVFDKHAGILRDDKKCLDLLFSQEDE